MYGHDTMAQSYMNLWSDMLMTLYVIQSTLKPVI